MADESYNARVRLEQDGKRLACGSSGSIDIESGGELDIESGGAFKIAGVAVSASAAELNKTDGLTATVAQLNMLSGVTAGTAAASKAVVLDANKDAASVRRFTVSQYLRGASESVASTATSTGAKATWSAVAAYGLSDLSSTGSTGAGSIMGFSLAHPGVAGVRKDLVLANGSTAKPAYVEVAAADQFIGGDTGSTGPKYHRLAFNDVGEAVSLISASSRAWRLLNNHNTVALTTNFTT